MKKFLTLLESMIKIKLLSVKGSLPFFFLIIRVFNFLKMMLILSGLPVNFQRFNTSFVRVAFC